MTDANGEFVHYQGLPTTAFPADKLLKLLEQGKKEGRLKPTREEFEWMFPPDTGDHGEPDGEEPLGIEIEIVDEDNAK